jgi:hypothetical protein
MHENNSIKAEAKSIDPRGKKGYKFKMLFPKQGSRTFNKKDREASKLKRNKKYNATKYKIIQKRRSTASKKGTEKQPSRPTN